MNKEKIINHFMVKIIEEARKGIAEINKPTDVDPIIIRVILQNIKYYAEMIIQKDGVI